MSKMRIDPDLQAQFDTRRAHEEIERNSSDVTTEFFNRKELERIQMERDCEEGAHNIRVLYNSYMNEGFTEEQAWELIKLQVAGASQPRKLF